MDLFLTHPPTYYVSINTILNDSQNDHFSTPPTQFSCWHNIGMVRCTECLFYSTLLSSQKALSQIEKNSNLLPAMLSGKDKMGMSVLGNWALLRSTNFRRLWHALNVVCDPKIGWFFSEGKKSSKEALLPTYFQTPDLSREILVKIMLRKYDNWRKIMWKWQCFFKNNFTLMCYALNVDCDLTILNGSSQRSNTLYTYVSTYVVYTYSNTLWGKVFSKVAFFKSLIHATLENSSPHCVQQQQ